MSVEKHIHIIAFATPYPPDYGGLIDVYFKLKALYENKSLIHLHCFTYDEKQFKELEILCYSIKYYKRNSMWMGLFSDKPFIVFSRNSKQLLKNLKQDNYPILFEGIHTCYYLNHPELKLRKKIVRMHNDEPAYYFGLAKRESSFFKKIYFYAEYKRLMLFEKVLSHASEIACISPKDFNKFSKKYKQTTYIGPFHGNSKISIKPERGLFILYHGNLSVNENQETVLFLLSKVFSKLAFPFYIAGKNPTQRIIDEVEKISHVHLIPNPSDVEIENLLLDAQIHLLITFQDTGIKLKLIKSIFTAKYIIANDQMVHETGLEQFIIPANTASEIIDAINLHMGKEISNEEIIKRRKAETLFSDQIEVQKIMMHL